MITHEHALKNGTVLNNYVIIKILGAGGFGITYLAKDKQLDMEVVIKEYFPSDLAIRKDDSTIISKSSNSENDFKKGMQRFREEAQTLATFDHPSIVKILNYFEANNTAYFVMEYEEGIDLSKYLKQKGTLLGQEEILSIIMPILEGLKEVHAHKYLHRDIKPGNILLRSNKSPVLIDFGASKLAIGEASKSITSMLTEGYAPLEQYSRDVKQQGPFTDIYAVAAVMYKMITGNVPPNAQTRSYALLSEGNDPLEPLMALKSSKYDGDFLKAVDRALSINAKERAQSVQEFQKDIAGQLKPKKKKRTKNNALLPIFIILIVSVIGVLLLQDKQSDVSPDVINMINKEQPDANITIAKVVHPGIEDLKIKKDKDKTKTVLKSSKEKNNTEQLTPEQATIKAFNLYTKACDGGDAIGCLELGVMYFNGEDIEQDYSKALEFYTKACDGGIAKGCSNLGLMYDKGQGMKRNDLIKAVELYGKACAGGYIKGCYNLGVMYHYGEGVKKEYLKSVELYRKACVGGVH